MTFIPSLKTFNLFFASLILERSNFAQLFQSPLSTNTRSTRFDARHDLQSEFRVDHLQIFTQRCLATLLPHWTFSLSAENMWRYFFTPRWKKVTIQQRSLSDMTCETSRSSQIIDFYFNCQTFHTVLCFITLKLSKIVQNFQSQLSNPKSCHLIRSTSPHIAQSWFAPFLPLLNIFTLSRQQVIVVTPRWQNVILHPSELDLASITIREDMWNITNIADSWFFFQLSNFTLVSLLSCSETF